MGSLLGWLASTYDVDLSEGVTSQFTSRGSNRWPEGTVVTARTISGHREMSQTTCPGDLGFAAIDSEIAPRARAVLAELSLPPTEPSTPTTTETSTTQTAETAAPTSTPAVTNSAPLTESSQEVVLDAEPRKIPTSWLVPAAAMAALAGAIRIRQRRV